MPPSIYSSLDFTKRESRLLRLAPSRDSNSTLETSLFKFGLNAQDRIPYQALSYVWGDPNKTIEIRINDSDVKVTESLATALRYIRSETEDKVLWVDAVCINQQDDLEKGYQVSNMASIYTEAESVIAWIGEESHNINLALEWITRFARWQRCAEKNLDESKALFNIERSGHDAIAELAQRPYWTRTWIVQELVLAKKVDVLCGKVHIPFDDLVQAQCAWMKVPEYWLKVPGRDQQGIYDMERLQIWIKLEASKMSSMLAAVNKFSCTYDRTTSKVELSYEFLQNFTHMDASDPRDKIYGLLGIVSRHCTEPLPIVPDYTKSVAQLYGEVARYLISESKNLGCLVYAGNQKCAQRIHGLPSWVPDWRGGNENFPLLRSQTKELTPPSSELIPAESGLLSEDGSTLRVKGFILDSVTNVQSNIWPFFGTDKSKFFDEILLGEPLGQVSSLEAYFRLMKLNQAMTRDNTTTEKLDPKHDSYWDAVVCFLKFITGPLGDTRLAQNGMIDLIDVFFDGRLDERQTTALVKHINGSIMNDERYYAGVLYTAANRISFQTSSGLLGLGSQRIRPGDLVCFLEGSSFPIILRKDSDHYTSIGESFILMLTVPDFSEEVVFEIR